jgi:O-acetyl-ADP-ribose deacetylase (regulator of RNase III)
MPNSPLYRVQINHAVLELLQGDITQQPTDAIVNAANSSLLGGGGVDGAIHRAAGPELLAETRTLGGCETGDAKITRGYKLKAKYVIHAVGPIYHTHNSSVSEQLASVYRRSMALAEANGIRTISFPSISTGAYGYPVEEAAPIALKTVIDYLIQHDHFERVAFILYNEPITEIYAQALMRLAQLDPNYIKPE